MDIKNLLEKIDQFAGQAVGQKPGDQWRGSDKAPPGKKLVGDSILKDLSKGKTPKSKAEELAEEYQAFLEAEFKDTVDKRPARKNARPSRGHAPQPGYKTVKADESYMSDKDIELQDYRSMTNQEFQTAYGISKMEWINQNKAIVIQNPDLKRALGLEEGWESGPEEYKEPYDDADDAYDRMRQEKIDTEAEKEWAKLPKVSTYKLIGRGPNMEPNYEFGDEFDSMEQALEYRAKIMKDPDTPHPEHIGIRTITRVVDKQQTNEAVYTAPRNQEDYDAKMTALQDLQMDPNTANDPELQKKIIIYMDNLQKIAHQKGWATQSAAESRGHKIIANKLKDIELSKKPPVEVDQKQRKAQARAEYAKYVAKMRKINPDYVPLYKMDEAGANNPPQQNISDKTTATPQQQQQIKNVAQGTQALKAAVGASASTDVLAKAIDSASKGTAIDATSAKALEPMMDVIKQAAQDPNLANQFKSLASQAKTSAAKQQTQQQKS